VSIYSAVLLLLLTGVYSVVEGGARYYRLAQAHQTVNQQAVIGMERVTRELSTASQSTTLPASASPQDHVLFLSAEPAATATGGFTFDGPSLEWKKWVCFYVNGSDQLVRAEDELTLVVTSPSAAPTRDFVTDMLPLPARPVAQGITEVEFMRAAPAVMQVEIVASTRTGSGKSTDVRLLSSVRLINF
jgi:hypothetical protein